jgi:hypothetical protein
MANAGEEKKLLLVSLRTPERTINYEIIEKEKQFLPFRSLLQTKKFPPRAHLPP